MIECGSFEKINFVVERNDIVTLAEKRLDILGLNNYELYKAILGASKPRGQHLDQLEPFRKSILTIPRVVQLRSRDGCSHFSIEI